MKASWIYVALLISLLLSCDRNHQLQDQKAIKIIYDTDMGNDTDDILALILLHNYVDLGVWFEMPQRWIPLWPFLAI